MSDVVQTLWGFCHTLRHDGIDYGDYIEQLTYLLFLKMADERSIELPKGCDWPTLISKSGTDLRDDYIDILRTLGKQRGLLGDIFAGSQSRFNNPVNLKKLLGVIDETEWTALGIDIKAAAFEGLLEKAASEGKKGAGQYFTPRLLIKAIVRCIKPDPRTNKEFTICDPACGTCGFIVSSYEWLIEQTKGALERDLAKRVKSKTYFGQELVERPRRLTLMNLYLHGLEPHIGLGDSIYTIPSGERFDVVMTNPPFGNKGANQAPTRDDFTISTSNKQLNFIQHVLTILKPGGRAAVVVPDNCIFADQAGEVFRILTEDCNLHTVLRLPNGTFVPYSPSKTNVIFFTKGYRTENVWVYDARSNVPHVTKKSRPLMPEHFSGFAQCFGADPNGRAKRSASDSQDGRWRCFSIDEIRERDFKIGTLRWLKDESLDEGEIGDPEELVTDIIAELKSSLLELQELTGIVENGNTFENGNTSGPDSTSAGAGGQNGEAGEDGADPELPEGWTTANLDELGHLYCGQSPPTSCVNSTGEGTPYVTGPDQWDGNAIRIDKWTTVPKRTVPEGSIFVTVKGAGVGTIFPGVAGAIGRDIYAFKPASAMSDGFVRNALEFTVSEIKNNAEGDIPGLSKDHLLQHAVKVPPSDEQKRIIAALDALFALSNSVRKYLTTASAIADRLDQAILAKAFRGELVPTEAELARREGREYEPASALLERIRKERESHASSKPERKRTRMKGKLATAKG